MVTRVCSFSFPFWERSDNIKTQVGYKPTSDPSILIFFNDHGCRLFIWAYFHWGLHSQFYEHDKSFLGSVRTFMQWLWKAWVTSTYVPAPAILVNLSRSKDLWGPSSDKNFFHLGKYAGLRFLQCTVIESNGYLGKKHIIHC